VSQLSRKLARLAGARPAIAPAACETHGTETQGTEAIATGVTATEAMVHARAEPGDPPGERDADRAPALPLDLSPSREDRAALKARIELLRDKMRALQEKSRSTVERASMQARARGLDALPFVREERHGGPVDVRARVYDVTSRHGKVPLSCALEATGRAVSTLAIDPGLSGFDPARALFVDTETTGLSGGTGTLAFLVGCGRFDRGRFVVEQWFLRDPGEEPAMLCALRERLEEATAIVSFNGKAFDLPLLRARYVMNRLGAPPTLPHFDLVHVARRIYGDRLAERRLVSLERDVLGFVREGDVPGGEIPARYASFLRDGRAEGLHQVIEHNLWDVIAMAALLGELGARVTGGDASGRFEASDLAGLARTALRAGEDELAIDLAQQALARGAEPGARDAASRAGAVAATAHRKRGEHSRSRDALLRVIAHAPEDARAHLELSKLYEHRYRDPERALAHARLAIGAERDDAMARRLRRLEARLRGSTLRLPGIH
jgi:uncharacterized protein YprB with RNaseH-like and TPR domain